MFQVAPGQNMALFGVCSAGSLPPRMAAAKTAAVIVAVVVIVTTMVVAFTRFPENLVTI